MSCTARGATSSSAADEEPFADQARDERESALFVEGAGQVRRPKRLVRSEHELERLTDVPGELERAALERELRAVLVDDQVGEHGHATFELGLGPEVAQCAQVPQLPLEHGSPAAHEP